MCTRDVKAHIRKAKWQTHFAGKKGFCFPKLTRWWYIQVYQTGRLCSTCKHFAQHCVWGKEMDLLPKQKTASNTGTACNASSLTFIDSLSFTSLSSL